MVFTRSGNGGGRGRGRGRGSGGEREREKMEVKRGRTGIRKSPNPRRSSGRLKAQTPRNYRELDTDESFCLSASTQHSPPPQSPFQLSQPAQGNLSFSILQYCYARRDVMKHQVGSPTRTPRSVEPKSQDVEKNVWSTCAMVETQPLQDGRPSASCIQGAFEDDATLHVQAMNQPCETTDHEVPFGEDLHGNIAPQNTNDNTVEGVGNAASNHFDDGQGQGGRAHNGFPAQLISHRSPSKSMNITEMVEQADDDLSDIDSLLGCESDMVSVEGYRAKPHYADILRTIISKHGDIGANCSLESIALRSLSMELLCQIVLELKASNNILHITEDKIVEMQASICDMERQRIEVGWLKTRLEEMLEAKLAMPILKPSSSVRTLRAECNKKVETLREQLTIYGKDIQALQHKIDATLREISHVQAEATKADSIISNSRSKLKHMFELGTLIGDLV